MPERIGLGLSIVLFAIPALMLWLATVHLVPALVGQGWEPLLAWFLSGALVFALLLAAAVVGAWLALPWPSLRALLAHLRLRPLSAKEWRLTGLVLALTIAAVAVLQVINTSVWPHLPPHPPFMSVKPLDAGQYYILALWLPFFALNIVGEELWWRGFIQPRQEPVFGRSTWLVQGVLHGLFHVSFGLGVMFILWPVLFAIPWAVQRSRNTSVGIIIHAGVNAPGFLAVTLGLLPV
jgi:membrane protease YdiL (CAAX protease family)